MASPFGQFLSLFRPSGEKSLQTVDNRNTFWHWIKESFPGAWQQNVEIELTDVLTFSTLYSCITLIASDIGKLGLDLKKYSPENGIWEEHTSPAFSPVLRKPNRYQTRSKFIEQWVVSKLVHGNTYVLKVRDNRNLVVELYVLDPTKVKPLVSTESGEVFYELTRDELREVFDTQITVPASEIIHDVMVPLYHPLVGVSPISACGLAAVQGLAIQRNSAKFFQNGSNPSGILTAPGLINDVTAARLKSDWESKFSGDNSGKVAVLGDGLSYQAMSMKAIDAQLIDQLKWTSETVCSVFHVPPYKIGVGPTPTYANAEVLNQIYYTDCLQVLIENIEALLDEGLALPPDLMYEFNVEDLLKMDMATKVKTLGEAVSKPIMTPNEARKRMGLKPIDGGDTVYLQNQNYSLAALSKRDQDLISGVTPPTPTAEDPPAEEPEDEDDDVEVEEDDDTENEEQRTAAAFERATMLIEKALADV